MRCVHKDFSSDLLDIVITRTTNCNFMQQLFNYSLLRKIKSCISFPRSDTTHMNLSQFRSHLTFHSLSVPASSAEN
jgi:hypothetical protein